MKIKTSFVTNSSSTSYILYLPESLNQEDVFKEFEDDGIFEDMNLKEEDFEEIKSFISSIFSGSPVYKEYDNNIDFEIREDICKYFEQFQIIGVDGSSGAGMMVNMNVPRYQQKIEDIKNGKNI